MIRYFILKDYGGIYSDLDLYPIENLEKYFQKNNNEVYFVFSGNINCFTNSFMASKRNTKIWSNIIDELILNKDFKSIPHLTMMYTTGPLMLNNVINKYTEIIGLLPRKKFMSYTSYENIKER